MAASNASTSVSADRELTFTRVFDAPRELVSEAWTNPKHLVHWWGPDGFTTTIQEMDVRPGGIWRLVMRGPDGRDYRNRIIFLEVSKPSRLVYKREPELGSEPASFQTTVTFEAEGCQTRVTLRMQFPTVEEREFVVTKYPAEEGAKQTLGRLAAHLPGMVEKDLVLTRVFDAPRELVFRAWTERERLQRWWGPHGFTNPECEMDVRPGGAIHIQMVGPDGWKCPPMTGTFLEIAAPERLVFTSIPLDPNGESLFEVLNVVTFEDVNGKTRLTLRAMVTKTSATAPQYLSGMDRGWSESLERLAVEATA
jgi:uncharacterized protein YndB with AHSA1/START domain